MAFSEMYLMGKLTGLTLSLYVRPVKRIVQDLETYSKVFISANSYTDISDWPISAEEVIHFCDMIGPVPCYYGENDGFGIVC